VTVNNNSTVSSPEQSVCLSRYDRRFGLCRFFLSNLQTYILAHVVATDNVLTEYLIQSVNLNILFC
jgi:hypothetical protein